MSCRKIPRITNLWSKVVDGEKGAWLSRVVIESTRTFPYTIKNNGSRVIVEGKGAVVNMPLGKIDVNDGLLREMEVKMKGQDTALVEMSLDHPAQFRLVAAEGFPFRLEITLDRSFLLDLFNGKKIVIDPGHGGQDAGGRGQVSLLEKDVVMPIAKNLEKLLLRAGAEVAMTRSGDEDFSWEDRVEAARRAGANVFISVHTHADADGEVDGASTLHSGRSGPGARLARSVQEGLVKKIKVRDRGTGQKEQLGFDKNITAIEVEVVTITNIVEEVFLRGLTIQKRAAEGVFNGLIKYFAPRRANSKR